MKRATIGLLLACLVLPALQAQAQGRKKHKKAAEPTATTADEAHCAELADAIVSELDVPAYPEALRLAKQLNGSCPSPTSTYLLGLVEANMVDREVLSDPAQLNLLREQAIEHLRASIAGGSQELPAQIRLDVQNWIRSLQDRAPAAEPIRDISDLTPHHVPASGADDRREDPTLTYTPTGPAPPPPASPSFPWGPIVLSTLAVGATAAAIVTGLESSSAADEAARTANDLRKFADDLTVEELEHWIERVQETQDDADTLERWTWGLGLGAGASLIGAVVWYAFLPPEGKWSWAATPTGVQVTARF